MSRKERTKTKVALRMLFEAGQRVGLDILPRHFYSSIPDIRALRKTSEWRKPHECRAVSGCDLGHQLRELEACFTEKIRSSLRASNVYSEACVANGAVGYGPIEAEVLYAYIARHQPQRVVQVGAGVATAVMLAAARDSGYNIQITCVDPFPTAYLVDLKNRGAITLLDVPAQEVALERLTDVGEDGLLFVDSTHTVKPGSEVNRIILDALPIMPSGSAAHFHDISFPYDYLPGLLDQDLFFWNESALLLAYLTDNPRARISFSTSMLHYGARPEDLRRIIPSYRPMKSEEGIRASEGHFPSSIFLIFGPSV